MKKLIWFGIILVALVIGVFALTRDYSDSDEPIEYGVSFSRFHSDELKLNWRETYDAILNDLGVRKFRFSAHWPLTEPEKDEYNFAELDYQMNWARAKGASVILAVGRRLPGWPECHVPDWAKNLSPEEFEAELFEMIETVVNRYKDYDNLLYWQVENEAFLSYFARHVCGPLDKDTLDREIAFVKELDPDTPILVTDSGEFGLWLPAYKRGDVFGTSIYLYVWPGSIGRPIRYPVNPAFFKAKLNLTQLIYGKKPAIVIELSTEPWLLQPIVGTPIETQLDRMGIDKFNEMIDFWQKTSFNTAYLWGAEWWYWLTKQGHAEHWERAKEIFNPAQ